MLALVVTGQVFMTQKIESSILSNNYKELSIQVSLSGLSFCIINSASKQIELFKKVFFNEPTTPEKIQIELDENMKSEKIHEKGIKKVHVVHKNELSTFVPKPLFTKNNLSDYLKFNVKILDNDFIAFDEVKNADIVNVYVPYANANNYIFDHFGEFVYKHFSSVLVETLLNKSQKTDHAVMYINVSKGYFEIVVIKNRQLLFYNTFHFLSKEDFIYYVLFTVEQLELNPEVFTLNFLGDINEDDDIYDIVYTYVRHVKFGSNFNVFEAIEGVKLPKEHEDLILLNSF